jgi:hypothetical protein
VISSHSRAVPHPDALDLWKPLLAVFLLDGGF